MSVLYLMIPIALILALTAVAGFVWAASRGQFDDVDTPANRVLLEDEQIKQ